MSPRRPKVVIVGAGFGGLEAAKALNRLAVDVTVIDRQNHHCFQPLLYQVATAALSPAEIAWPIRHILRQQRNATVLMAEVSGIDLAGRCVQTSAGPISYDYLVIATGATHSYFGHDDWIDFAPGLKRIEDATRIRRSILLAFEHAELAHDDAERQRLLTFVIVGGGATGVEMAGAIAEIARQTLAKDFRRIDPRSSRIILLEAGPRVLPTLPEDLSRYAEHTLTRMGVDVRTSTPVINCDRRGVDLDRGRIDASTIIWAAGVVASPAARWLGAEHDRAGRVLVRPDLSLPDHPEVFVIGDAAGVHDQTGAMVPGVAQAAKQMGRYVGRVIAARVDETPSLPPFRYRSFGDLATIGRRAAVVNFGYLRLKGFVGWLFWSLVHIYFLIGVKNRFIVAFTWLWDYLTFHRGARLITEVPPPGRG
ncbi:MAG: NAD(P)/FAD-dependent oxidoreductase [Alphaproteobacteria bacterium]|jgi:NADH:ubiquinone reductase (H+-translocating)|nr:MAG: NAD(P)/FAD-dependent oxidoreductase [Alphaproteobacteria bacterium]